jgi:hypothetical protein
MKPYNFYSLALAITHAQEPVATLGTDCDLDAAVDLSDSHVLVNLTTLEGAMVDPELHEDLTEFIRAGSAATNTEISRRTRFRWFCKAITQPALR